MVLTMSPVFHCIYNPNWRWVILSVFLWRLGKTTVMLTCRCSQQRPDHCKLVNALFAWIAEADQHPQVICRDDLQEDQMVFFGLAQVERVHTKASSKIKRIGRSVSQRRMPREIEKPPLTMIDEKPTDGTSTSKKDQDAHGMMKSENFF